MSKPTLHMICGKIAAGKSTLAKDLAAAPGTILFAEDFWLSRLYKDEQKTLADYARNSGRLRAAISPLIVDLLKAGLSVVLDFPANTVVYRQWLRSLFEAAGAAHCLHFLDLPDEICRQRLRARNRSGSHEYTVTDAEFDQFTNYFVPPGDAEGFEVVIYCD